MKCSTDSSQRNGMSRSGQANSPTAGQTLGRFVQSAALLVVLVTLVGRCFLAEMPFHRSSRLAFTALHSSAEASDAPFWVDRTELVRVSLATILVGCAAVWLIGSALTGRVVIHHRLLLGLIVLFAAWSLASALGASNKRLALVGWIEQVSLLTSGWLIAQICIDRKRFVLVVVVLAGLAGAMTVKSICHRDVEVPRRIRDFEMYRGQRLAQEGLVEGTPQAEMFETRLRATEPEGYFGLANLFGSLLILLFAAAAGLAGEKIRRAVQTHKARKNRGQHRPGQIDPQLLWGVLLALVALGTLGTLLLTRSRGAIGAVVIAMIGALVVYAFGRRWARHGRKAVIVVSLAFVLTGLGVIGYGLKTDRLPTKTMTFRWFYWTASTEIVADRPLWGVGPANFPAAYLQHRRPAGEEDVKTPHNVLVHAATQYGLPGGLLYIGAILYVLIGATRPGRNLPNEQTETPKGRITAAVALAVVLAVTAVLVRILLVRLTEPYLLLFDVILPAMALGLCVLVAWWGQELFHGTMRPLRIALAAGCIGFFLHNMVSFSFWTPATAMVFWVMAGACLAQGQIGKETTIKRLRWLAADGGILAVVAATGFLLLPVAVRQKHTEAMIHALERKNPADAVTSARAAACADLLDPVSASDTAKLLAAIGSPAPGQGESHLREAYIWAQQAIKRDSAQAVYRLHAANIALEVGSREKSPWHVQRAMQHMAEAIERNPNDARLRRDYARMLLKISRYRECLEQLTAAEQLEAHLFPESTERFTLKEVREIEAMRQQALRKLKASVEQVP